MTNMRIGFDGGFNKIILALVLVVLSLCFAGETAYAMKISPPRLVFEDGVNMQYLYIKNSTPHKVAYRFGWRHLAMTTNGDVVNVDNEGAPDVPLYTAADDLVRFSPRRTTLEPGQTQRISMLVRRPASLPDGEYRSHFVIEQLPAAEDDVGLSGDGNAAVGVKLLVSRAIPVYVRKGKNDVSVQLLSASLVPHPEPKRRAQIPYFVEVRVGKTGNRSVIAYAHAYCGDVRIDTASKLFAVYAEASSRAERIPVNPSKAGKNCSNMRVEIVGHMDDPLQGKVLATGAVSR